MPRLMSFAMTTAQIRAGTKKVTRRLGWWNAKPGDIYEAIEKGQGMKKGERVTRIRMIQVVSVRRERLDAITDDDCVLEGFPLMTAPEFVRMFCSHNKGKKITPATIVNRIEFEYIHSQGLGK